MGYCVSNPGYMIPLCTQSCLGCTTDPVCQDNPAVAALCPGWASSPTQGCAANPAYMYSNCWKSCLNCASAPTCANVADNSLCELWAANGSCSNNAVWMYANCALACTRCQPYVGGKPNCVNAYLNDTACAQFASQGDCVTNPSFMYAYCYKTCTSCYQAGLVGSNPLPGAVLADTASYSIILPFSFTNTSTLNQWTVFFATNNSVHLQVWRPNGANSFNLTYDQLVTPAAANETQVFAAPACWHVLAGDQIGFTSLTGAAPIAYNIDPVNYYQYSLRQATSGTAFSTTSLPFVYSLSAQYSAGFAC